MLKYVKKSSKPNQSKQVRSIHFLILIENCILVCHLRHDIEISSIKLLESKFEFLLRDIVLLSFFIQQACTHGPISFFNLLEIQS